MRAHTKQRISIQNILTVLVLCMSISLTAHAACTSPSGNEGDIIYNTDHRVPQLCSAAGIWIALGAPNNAAGGAGCSSPTGVTGQIIYNDDNHFPQYCDSQNWKRIEGRVIDPCDYVSPGDEGTICGNGSIYAGVSPDGSVPMFTTPADAGSLYTWDDGTSNFLDTAIVNCNDNSPGTASSCQTGQANTALLVALNGSGTPAPYAAAEYCNGLSVHGQSDWYLPASDELNVLYTNKNAGDLNGTFNETGSWPAGYYWSSSETNIVLVRDQRFDDGNQSNASKDGTISVRCVRKN